MQTHKNHQKSGRLDTPSNNSWRYHYTGSKVLNEDNESRLHHRYAAVVQDLATQWIQSYPCRSKTRYDEKSAEIFPPESKPGAIYTDIFLRVHKSLRRLGSASIRNKWNRRKSDQKSKRREFALLVQSGLDEQVCGKAMDGYCYSRNTEDLSADGKTLDERRYDTFPWSTNTLWTEIFCRPISSKTCFINSARKTSKVFLLDMLLNAAGGWTGNLLVADAEDLSGNPKRRRTIHISLC